MLRTALIRIFINSAALWLVDVIFDGIQFNNSTDLIIAAIVFGVLNTILKPLLVLFTLPINILTLGIFTLVINAIILEITAHILGGFYLDNFGTAFLAAIIISIVSMSLDHLIENNSKK